MKKIIIFVKNEEYYYLSNNYLIKKGDREDPGNYRGITLLGVVGKVFSKILNNRLVQCLDKEGALHEGQAGFRLIFGECFLSGSSKVVEYARPSCMSVSFTVSELCSKL